MNSIFSGFSDEASKLWEWSCIILKSLSAIYSNDLEKVTEVLTELDGKVTNPSFKDFGLLAVIDRVEFLDDIDKVLPKLLDPTRHKSWYTLNIVLSKVSSLFLKDKIDPENYCPLIEALTQYYSGKEYRRVQTQAAITMIVLGKENLLPKEFPAISLLLEKKQEIQNFYQSFPSKRLVEVPETIINFTGRDKEIHVITDSLAQQWVVLVGIPGKSEIAKKVAYLVNYKFVLWIESSNQDVLRTAFSKIGS